VAFKQVDRLVEAQGALETRLACSKYTPHIRQLTSINLLRRGLVDLAIIVNVGLSHGQTSCRTILVQVAAIIHGLLEGVALPAKHVVSVSGRTTGQVY
jgi:hypothetical protein